MGRSEVLWSRIPTIVYQPHARANGQKIETPVSTIDFFPTLLEMTGTGKDKNPTGKTTQLESKCECTENYLKSKI